MTTNRVYKRPVPSRDCQLHRELGAILTIIQETLGLVLGFVRTHGLGCPCWHCRNDEQAIQLIADDLRGLVWAFSLIEGRLDSEIGDRLDPRRLVLPRLTAV